VKKKKEIWTDRPYIQCTRLHKCNTQ